MSPDDFAWSPATVPPQIIALLQPHHPIACRMILVMPGRESYCFDIAKTDDGWVFPTAEDERVAFAWRDDWGACGVPVPVEPEDD